MDGRRVFNQRELAGDDPDHRDNIVAGLLIGTLQQGIDRRGGAHLHDLTVGDGLVTMIPSLLVSVAGRHGADRASSAGQLTTELGRPAAGKGHDIVCRQRRAGALC